MIATPTAAIARWPSGRSLDQGEQPLVPARLPDDSSLPELAGQPLLDGEADASPRPPFATSLQGRLETALTSLADDDREVILMRHGEQLTNQQVATTLGLTEPAASMRYLRAVRRLRAALLPEGEGDKGE